MKFSTRSTYGLRAMIHLAKLPLGHNASLPSIAESEGISLGYLEKIFSHLKKAGLIKAEKGAKGGYLLGRKASLITVFEIINVLEGGFSPFHCLDSGGKVYCGKKCDCGALKVLRVVQEQIRKTLEKINLKELT